MDKVIKHVYVEVTYLGKSTQRKMKPKNPKKMTTIDIEKISPLSKENEKLIKWINSFKN